MNKFEEFNIVYLRQEGVPDFPLAESNTSMYNGTIIALQSYSLKNVMGMS